MRLKETRSSEKFQEKNDWRNLLEIEVDGARVFRFLDGEPEDAKLSRDFNDAYKIVDMLEKAYDAGYKREGFKLDRVEVDDFE